MKLKIMFHISLKIIKCTNVLKIRLNLLVVAMSIKIRSFLWENDFDLVQDFLRETYELTKNYINWIPQRFENRRFGPCGTEYQDEEDDLVKIWEDTKESKPKIVAVTILNSSGANWINIHPNYRFLEKELILWIENQTKEYNNFYVLENDQIRNDLLLEFGYKNQGCVEYTRTRPIDLSILDYELPKGYTIKNVNINKDFVKYREVMGSVFPHCNKMTEKLFNNYTKTSFYNPELDILAVAPDEGFAAFCTIRFDPISRIAEIEPVGTHPNHRRLGLGKAVIIEGLKRLKKYKPKAIVITGAANTVGANCLYDSLGFTDKISVLHWFKK
ncbi:MAG: GNAT family N-acetyltransferase [Asgard group archaeon]|nr:GNAT family N-acetyltransferase [Asgard group archaeon]